MTIEPGSARGAPRSGFAPDCAACVALCCMVPAFDKGAAFAIDKPAGLPCPHLSRHDCLIHARLRAEGFSGCVGYNCLGAGQLTTAAFGGESWRDDASLALPMGDAFRLLREVQDIRAQLAAGLGRVAPDAPVRLRIDRLDALLSPEWTPAAIADFDITDARTAFAAILDDLRRQLRG